MEDPSVHGPSSLGWSQLTALSLEPQALGDAHSRGIFSSQSCSCFNSLTSGEKNLLRQRIQKTERRIQPAGDGEGRGVLEARKRIKYAVVVSLWQAQHDTEFWGFFWFIFLKRNLSDSSSKPWLCLLHCGDLKKPVLLPQWVPYTQDSVKIDISVLVCPGGLILAMLGL